MKVVPDEVSDFFLKTFRDLIEFREKNEVRRNDGMQLLIDLHKKGYIEDVDSSTKEGTSDKSKLQNLKE